MPPDDDFPSVFVEEQSFLAPLIEAAPTSRTVIAGLATGLMVRQIVEFSSFAEVKAHPQFSNLSKAVTIAAQLFFENNGRQLAIFGLADLSDPSVLDPLKNHAFNLLCLPTALGEAEISPELHAAANRTCIEKRAIYLVDPPSSWSVPSDLVSTAIAGAEQLLRGATNAALYFPRINLLNGIDGFAPSAAIAGFLAGNDVSRGVWKAPAGVDATLKGVSALAIQLTDNQNHALNSVGINALRQHGLTPPIIWGARTRAGDDSLGSEWKYLPIRRLALFIETSVVEGLTWAVFEANDEILWSRVRQTISNFLTGLFRQGAFRGQTPRDSFFVKCDRSTMSQDDLNAGRLVCQIGFAPLKPAEFIIISITAKTADSI